MESHSNDFAYERTRENTRRLAEALKPFNPRPRNFPDNVPFVFDGQTLLSNEVLTLETTAGDVDLLGSIKGIGGFREVDSVAETMNFDGHSMRVLTFEALLVAKRAAGRPKDAHEMLELEALQEARAAVARESVLKVDPADANRA